MTASSGRCASFGFETPQASSARPARTSRRGGSGGRSKTMALRSASCARMLGTRSACGSVVSCSMMPETGCPRGGRHDRRDDGCRVVRSARPDRHAHPQPTGPAQRLDRWARAPLLRVVGGRRCRPGCPRDRRDGRRPALVRRGLVAEHGSSWVLPRLIGHARALDLLYSGRVFLAEEAKELGVVNQVFAPEELIERTREYATDLIRHCSPRSMATIKAEIYRHWNMALAPAVKEANELMVRSFGFPDFKEGVQSFVQRRNPDFASLPADYEVLPKEWN